MYLNSLPVDLEAYFNVNRHKSNFAVLKNLQREHQKPGPNTLYYY